MKTPYYSLVPKDLGANLRFRAGLLREARDDLVMRRQLWDMCAADFLFYLNAFAFTYDPRLPSAVVPMVTYDYQDEALGTLHDAVGVTDLAVEKSRDMGASWMCLQTVEHYWHFGPPFSALLVSRNEDYVDKPGNPKCLFWKIDFQLQYLPPWLRPLLTRQRLHLSNDDTGSVIDGESTTGDVARGDRRTVIVLDEFGAFGVDDSYKAMRATRDATRSRFFNSTPAGGVGAYYDVTHPTELPGMPKITLHWSLHPEKAKGLYQAIDGQLVILDQAYQFPEDYPFVLDGEKRSPWYDGECRRATSKAEINQELNLNYLGSSTQWFDADLLAKLKGETCLEPFYTGELEFGTDDLQPKGLTEVGGGRLRLWTHVDGNGKLLEDQESYVIGGDIATGTGASNSCLSVVRATTGVKVAEFTDPNIQPDELAKVAVVLARWFNNALLIWEANGAGRIFGDRIVEHDYREIWFRQDEQGLSHKTTDVPGWYSTKDNKRSLLGEYRRALSTREFINRSAEALGECGFYVFGDNGSVLHSHEARLEDPSGARENHGDRVIADALAWRGARARRDPQQEPEHYISPASFAGRQEQARARTRDEKEYWRP